MLYALVYAIIRRVLRLSGISSDAEAEGAGPAPRARGATPADQAAQAASRDKLFLSAMSRMLPRERWARRSSLPRPHWCGGTESSFGASGPISTDLHRASTHRLQDQGPDPAHGEGEPALGVRADQG
jgi:hypothetical protein